MYYMCVDYVLFFFFFFLVGETSVGMVVIYSNTNRFRSTRKQSKPHPQKSSSDTQTQHVCLVCF